jgi:hypothetical protein
MRLTIGLFVLAAAPAAHAQCWSETAKLTAAAATVGDRLGTSVAIDGSTAVAGAAFDDWNGNYTGSVHVFERDLGGPGAWGQSARVVASDASPEHWFGMAVALHDDTLVVGAPRSNVFGAVYVFERDLGGPGVWGEIARRTAPSPSYLSDYGEQLALAGDTLVVGAAHEATVHGQNSGTVYVYERDLGGPDAWGLAAQLFSSDIAPNDQFGSSVAISADTILVGATLDDDLGDASGSAYVFQRDHGGPGAWGEMAKLLAHDGGTDSFFGSSVSIDGDTAIVAAPFDDYLCKDTIRCNAGAAYVFERHLGGPNAWGEVKKLTPSHAVPGGRFGQAASLVGDVALVGANDGVPGVGSAVFAFERDLSAPDAWEEAALLLPSIAQIGSRFGTAVAWSGSTAVVGAPGEDAAAPLSGAAYVYERDPAIPYCTAGVSTSGCRAILTACGTPSATAPNGFTLTARDAEGGRAGLFYFGANGRQATPWGASSFQCVVPPVVRTGVLAGAGTPDTCEGAFALDLNALWCPTCPHASANPGAGATIQGQLWYRQPPGDDLRGTNLSGAVELTVAP